MVIKHTSGSKSQHHQPLDRSKLKMTVAERILKILAEESRCLTFDELYHKTQPDCDWVSFAGVLEDLVEQGKVQYITFEGKDRKRRRSVVK